ncbi:MAG: flagellar motor switch protein FliG [Acidobacteriia bacterium]|nr:flagellar motor switch protein FliG [Terriglobia bacterium]
MDELQMSGLKKAAILLILLGEDASSAIYRHLTASELQQITDEISGVSSVSPAVADKVLGEYYRLSLTPHSMAGGGPELAAKLLTHALGEENARDLIGQASAPHEDSVRNFEMLQKADPQQLVKFVQAEHPQTIAMVLAHLGTRAASSLLVLLPEKLQGQTIRRLADMQQFSPEMVQKISLVLHRKVMALGDQVRRSYGGVKAAAELLNRVDPTVSRTILETVEADDAHLALNIRNSMFTFADLIGVPEAGIRDLLAAIDKRTLGLALKGASEDLRNHIFKTMSSRAVEMLKEDMDTLGPVRAQAVNQAQQEIVQAARTLETQGKLILHNDQQEVLVV